MCLDYKYYLSQQEYNKTRTAQQEYYSLLKPDVASTAVMRNVLSTHEEGYSLANTDIVELVVQREGYKLSGHTRAFVRQSSFWPKK